MLDFSVFSESYTRISPAGRADASPMMLHSPNCVTRATKRSRGDLVFNMFEFGQCVLCKVSPKPEGVTCECTLGARSVAGKQMRS